MVITEQMLVTMLRNVTGRVDASDPLFTNEIMVQYLQQNIALITTQDVRLYQNQTWWEFTYGPSNPDPLPVDLQQLGFSNLGAPTYADGFYVFWYQNPADFYRIWPETQEYTPTRPTYALYYNNEITFRNPPDREYAMKIQAYRVELQIDADGLGDRDYMYRYIVYGTALDIFNDFGESDKAAAIMPAYTRYRALVYARTNIQYQQERAGPDF